MSGNLSEVDAKKIAEIRNNGVGNVVSEELLHMYSVLKEEIFIVPCDQGDFKVYVYWPKESKEKLPLYVNAHGGGFVKGMRQQDIVFARNVSSNVECVVMDIDYTPAPDLMFPGQIYQSYEAVRFAIAHQGEWNIDVSKIAMGGHSAGGSITTAVSLLAGQKEEFKLCLQILNYSGFDLYKPIQLKRNGYANPRIKPDKAEFYNRMYLKEDQKLDPLASPLYAPDEMLRKLPDTLIIECDQDFFCDEGIEFARRLMENGVFVMQKSFMNSKHGFLIQRKDEFEEAEKIIFKQLERAFQ